MYIVLLLCLLHYHQYLPSVYSKLRSTYLLKDSSFYLWFLYFYYTCSSTTVSEMFSIGSFISQMVIQLCLCPKTFLILYKMVPSAYFSNTFAMFICFKYFYLSFYLHGMFVSTYPFEMTTTSLRFSFNSPKLSTQTPLHQILHMKITLTSKSGL